MEKMVGLFTVVVEGTVEYTSAVTLGYVKRNLKKALEKEVNSILNHKCQNSMLTIGQYGPLLRHQLTWKKGEQ